MKPLHIDFAPRSVRRAVSATGALIWLCAGIGLLLCTVAAIQAWNLVQQYRTDERALARANSQLTVRTARPPAPKPSAIPTSQADAVNHAIAQLNLPWRDVLDAIESATPPTIALVALEPDAKKHLVRGEAEAKSSDAMIAYIVQLKLQAFFREVVLVKHQINEQDPNKPIRFQFEAQWNEDAP